MRLAVVALVSSACAQVSGDTTPRFVQPPPPGVPFGYRYAQFTANHGVKVTRDYRGFSLQRSSYSSPYLLLANGAKVWDIVELAPYVAPETDLGVAIAKQQRGRARERTVNVRAIASLGASVVLVLVGSVALKNDQRVLGGIAVGAGAASFFGGIGYWTFAPRERAERKIDDSVRDDYNASLARTLRVCITALHVVDCDAQLTDTSRTSFGPTTRSTRHRSSRRYR